MRPSGKDDSQLREEEESVMDIDGHDSEDQDISANSDAHHDGDEEDDEDDSLARLSAQYRRFSEARRVSESGEGVDKDNVDEDEGPDDHHYQHDYDEDEEEDEENHREEDEDEDEDEDGEDFHSRSEGSQRRRPGLANSLYENMARMFPEASGLFGALGGGGVQLSGLIDGLNRRDDPFLVLETLNEVSDKLLMINTLVADRGFPARDLSNALVNILNEPLYQEELELQLVACRCYYNFLEINNEYVSIAVDTGAIEALQAKLLEISYIDLAEQTLQTLELISRFCGSRGCRKISLLLCLQYIDFFTIHAQRKAINIIANAVKTVRESDFSRVQEIFPILQRIVIEFTDNQELETTWLAISRIVKSFSKSNQVSKLVSTELLQKMVQAIASSDITLSTNLKLIEILTICSNDNELSVSIIKNGNMVESLFSALSKYKKTNETSISMEGLMSVPKELILKILDLFINLLPCEEKSILTYYSKSPTKNYSSIKHEYVKFVNDIFQLLINIYSSTVVFDIRRRTMVCLVRIISSLDNITQLKDLHLVINLLASIVIQNKSIIRSDKQDPKPYIALLGSLVLTHLLIEKDNGCLIRDFEREGLLADNSSLLEILRQEDYVMGEAEDNEQDEMDQGEETPDEARDEDENIEDQNDYDDEGDYDDYDDNDDFSDDDDEQDNTSSAGHVLKDLCITTISKYLVKLTSGIEQTYLAQKASGHSKLEHLRLLDEINAELKDHRLTDAYSEEEWNGLWKSFKNALITDSFIISSFELISSGIIETLGEFFSKPKHGAEHAQARVSFMEVFSGSSFETLIKKLQESLTRSESFEIITCGLKTGENRADSLAKQIKVRLSLMEESSDQEDLDEINHFEGMKQFVILVHAIASLSNINTFLKRRVEAPLIFGGALRRASSSGSDPSKKWHLEFLLDGEIIPADATIYGALFKHEQLKNPNFDPHKFWHETHEISFRKAEGDLPAIEFDERYPEISEEESQNLKHPITLAILDLLKILHDFHEQTFAASLNVSATSASIFLNFKLTAKVNRQLEEPLIVASGILPNWCIIITRKYPFLFPLQTRIFFLQSTSFGYSRLIQLWSSRANQEEDGSDNNSNSSSNPLSLGRATRHKARVSRRNVMASAFQVLEKLGSHPSIIEIEFLDEVGTGLGPTLEFYSSVCHQFAGLGLHMWRSDNSVESTEKQTGAEDSDEFVSNQFGLFPAPVDPKQKSFTTKMRLFKFLGKFIARALLDNRILDFNFNRIFMDLCTMEVANQEFKFPLDVAFEKLQYVDPRLYQSLKYMKDNGDDERLLEGMSINFTLPGYEEIELIEDGSNIYVTSSNLDDYISNVIDYTMGKGIKEQVQNFIFGFSEVFPFYSMMVFSSNELVELFGSSEEDWSFETLITSVHADHGYNIDSPVVQNLLLTMSQFSQHDRRLFLQFLTGSPKLPIGGFKNLKPDFTVVLKHTEDGLKADDYLPSVMTCANYLKLPNYSSIDVLKQRLNQAINEGAGAFLLS